MRWLALLLTLCFLGCASLEKVPAPDSSALLARIEQADTLASQAEAAIDAFRRSPWGQSLPLSVIQTFQASMDTVHLFLDRAHVVISTGQADKTDAVVLGLDLSLELFEKLQGMLTTPTEAKQRSASVWAVIAQINAVTAQLLSAQAAT